MRYIIDIDRVESENKLSDILSTFDANIEGAKKAACDKLDELKREFEPKIKVTCIFDETKNIYQNDVLRKMAADRQYWASLQATNAFNTQSQLQGVHHMANMSHAGSPYSIVSNAARQLGL
jgi:hypothetical protein